MKPLVGGLTGAVLAVVAIMGWNGRAADRAEAWGAGGPGVQLASHAPRSLTRAESEAQPLSVRCESGQRAVVRQTLAVSGQAMEAACVSDGLREREWVATPTAQAPTYASGHAPFYVPAPEPRAVPASYRVEAPRPSPARQVVYRDAPTRRVEPQRRSWKKTALVIGGGAGAGAGIGAIAGGKKGALVGAAIGGGAGTLYEVAKR